MRNFNCIYPSPTKSLDNSDIISIDTTRNDNMSSIGYHVCIKAESPSVVTQHQQGYLLTVEGRRNSKSLKHYNIDIILPFLNSIKTIAKLPGDNHEHDHSLEGIHFSNYHASNQ